MPITIRSCDNSAEQQWRYDRKTSRIFNPTYECLEIAPSARIESRTWDPDPRGGWSSRSPNVTFVAQSPIASGSYADSSSCGAYSPGPSNPLPRSQQWTYDLEKHILMSGDDTVLDVQWGNLTSGTPVWVWDENDGYAQTWQPE